MLRQLRAVLRPFAIQAAYNPIETIVFFSVVGTLGYFHILNAIKHSSFFAPTAPPPLRPSHVILRHDTWVPTREHVWSQPRPGVLSHEVQQLVFATGLDELANVTDLLTSAPQTLGPHHVSSTDTPPTVTVTLAFARAGLPSILGQLPPDLFSVLPVSPSHASYTEPIIGQTDSPKWIAYAARALILRFYTLAKKADSLDILLILVGYVLMHTTFYLLISRSRALGSNFWLPAAIMSSSILALLLSVPIALALAIPIDPVALTEALPFLVCTVGFDKPLRLARAVFLHPHLTTPPVALSSLHNSLPLKPAAKILTESLSLTYPPIIRDYILEIAVLVVGANSKVAGLREVCALAAILLAVDCLLMCTYLVGVLGVMIEVRRIQTLRHLTKSQSRPRSRSNSVSSYHEPPSYAASPYSSIPGTPSSASARHPTKSAMVQPPPPLAWRERLLGVKGASLKLHNGKTKDEGDRERENPVARLKLLLIVTFLTLHILNLCAPLAPASLLRHRQQQMQHQHKTYDGILAKDGLLTGEGQQKRGRVDVTGEGVAAVLDQLAAEGGEDELVVRVSAPIWVDVLSKAHTQTHGSGGGTFTEKGKEQKQKQTLDTFMSSWTRLVGDPVLSKWIVVVLAISISLNGYLLKGIAAGVAAGTGGAGWGVVGKEGGVRFEASEENGDESHGNGNNNSPGIRRRKGSESESESGGDKRRTRVPTFTLEDVDRRLEARLSPPPHTHRGHSNSNNHTPSSPSPAFPSASSTTTAVSLSPLPPPTLPLPSPPPTDPSNPPRPLADLVALYESAAGKHGKAEALAGMTDEEVILLTQKGKVAVYALEGVLSGGESGWGIRGKELERAVRVRRGVVSRASNTQTLENSLVPFAGYDYTRVLGACCENVVGYVPLPLGIAGPLTIDGRVYPIPMATAEGTLVASTSRGCKALNAGGGVRTVLLKDGMTRGPALEFPSIEEAARAARWLSGSAGGVVGGDDDDDEEDDERERDEEEEERRREGHGGEGWSRVKAAFEGTSRFLRLREVKCAVAGRTLFARFVTATGDAMGMNMISKGTEAALALLHEHFPGMVVLCLSGNYCTDKKAAAINWIEGRGKSVVAEAVVPGEVVRGVLKTTVEALCKVNTKKNLVGSAMAGAVGGFNAHAANILTAVYLATGQDPAQNVESSNCMTLMEPTNDGMDLLVTITMPSIEVGTVGGGTILAPQGAVLDLLGIRGAHPSHPGRNAQRLARIIAAAVMAGELSLISALAAGHLVKAHLKHNRSAPATPAGGVRGVVVGGILVGGAGKEGEKTGRGRDGESTVDGKSTAGGESTVDGEKGVRRSDSTASLPPYSK